MTTHFDKTFRASGSFGRQRVAGLTWLGIGVIVVASVGIVLTAQNFIEIAEWAREGTENSVRARNRTAGIMPLVIIVVGLGAIAWGVRLLFLGSRPWHVVETGTRLRKRYYGFHDSNQSFLRDLHARFVTGDPAVYTPLPDQVKGGQSILMIWTADADHTGYIGLSWDQNRRRTVNGRLIVASGVHYEALEAALRNTLHKPLPDELNPLRRPGAVDATAAASPAASAADAPAASAPGAVAQAPAHPQPAAVAPQQPASDVSPAALAPQLQPWSDFLAAGNRFDAPVDAQRLASARRWNTGALATVSVLAVLAALLLVVLLSSGRAHPTLVTVSIVFVAAMIPSTLKLRGTRRRNLRAAARDGLAMTVTCEGVGTPRIRQLPWSAVKGVVLFDDTTRNAVQGRVPVFGWGTGLALRAGEGVVAITLALHDGEAVRATVQPPTEAKHIRLWSKDARGLRPGDVTVTPDVTMSPDTVRDLLAAVAAGAHLAGVPVYRPTETRQWVRLLGKVITGER